MKEKIEEKFKEWRKALRAAEMQVIDNLHLHYMQFEDKFSQSKNHNQKMRSKAEVWMEKATQ